MRRAVRLVSSLDYTSVTPLEKAQIGARYRDFLIGVKLSKRGARFSDLAA